MTVNFQAVFSAETATASADAVLRAKGRSFYWARHLLGARHGQNATRLYAFCRLLDDIADEAPSPALARKKLDVVAACVTSRNARDPTLIDALNLIEECKIEARVALDLIEAIASDLGLVRVPDEAALMRYCYGVAGTVGLMMCKVLDVKDEAALRHAVDLGLAMQLTNICRDVVEDAAAGRRYLPGSLLGDIGAEDLVRPGPAVRIRIRSCLKTLLDRADDLYRSGELGIGFLPPGARGGILSAARIYQAIGQEIRDRNYAVWDGRAVVGTRRKLALTATALARVFLDRRALPAGTRRNTAPLKRSWIVFPHVVRKDVVADYDVLIIGGGCAGLSLARRLAAQGAQAPRTLVLERRTRYADDRTWCFWDDGSMGLSHIASCWWTNMMVKTQGSSVRFHCEETPYHQLGSARFYDDALGAIRASDRVEIATGSEICGEPQKDAGIWRVETKSSSISARLVVDTRPSRPVVRGGAKLWQSFYGREIDCDADVFDPSCVELMDFAPASLDRIQFTYVLPVSPNRALIETTVFDVDPCGPSDLGLELDKAVALRTLGHAFRVRREENGVLPMGAPRTCPNGDSSYVFAGLDAGGARPSSGYAFRRIQLWAQECAVAIRNGKRLVPHAKDPILLRLMDSLFLSVLRNRPDCAPELFLSMFRKADTKRMIRFMSDGGGLIDYGGVASALPAGLFLAQIPPSLFDAFRVPRR